MVTARASTKHLHLTSLDILRSDCICIAQRIARPRLREHALMSTSCVQPLVSSPLSSTVHVDALADLTALHDAAVNVCVLRRLVDAEVHRFVTEALITEARLHRGDPLARSSLCGSPRRRATRPGLDHVDVDRSRLGHAAGGLSDAESGLIRSGAPILQMSPFEVGLFKGEAWEGNTGRGAVHRSPSGGARRVLLTLEAL